MKFSFRKERKKDNRTMFFIKFRFISYHEVIND